MSRKIIEFLAIHQKVLTVISFAALIVFPFLFGGSSYIMNIAAMSLIYAVLALSLNFITGFLGITSLGHAAFFGIGAYTAALLSTKLGWTFLLTLLSSAVIAALFGFLLGLITLRVSGKYLAIVTIGFCEIARLVELNWYSLTRGPLGIMNIPAPVIFGHRFKTLTSKYFIILVLLGLTVLVVSRIANSRIGRAVSAIKSDNLVADVMGINVRNVQVMVFVISAAFAGMAGGFYAHYISFIDPNSFNYAKSVQILSMAILGGMGSIPGSIIGAIILTILPEALRNFLLLRQVIYGVVIIVIVLYRPAGLMGGFNLRYVSQQLQFKKLKAKVAENEQNSVADN